MRTTTTLGPINIIVASNELVGENKVPIEAWISIHHSQNGTVFEGTLEDLRKLLDLGATLSGMIDDRRRR